MNILFSIRIFSIFALLVFFRLSASDAPDIRSEFEEPEVQAEPAQELQNEEPALTEMISPIEAPPFVVRKIPLPYHPSITICGITNENVVYGYISGSRPADISYVFTYKAGQGIDFKPFPLPDTDSYIPTPFYNRRGDFAFPYCSGYPDEESRNLLVHRAEGNIEIIEAPEDLLHTNRFIASPTIIDFNEQNQILIGNAYPPEKADRFIIVSDGYSIEIDVNAVYRINNHNQILGRRFLGSGESAIPMLLVYDFVQKTTSSIIEDNRIQRYFLNDAGEVFFTKEPEILESLRKMFAEGVSKPEFDDFVIEKSQSSPEIFISQSYRWCSENGLESLEQFYPIMSNGSTGIVGIKITDAVIREIIRAIIKQMTSSPMSEKIEAALYSAKMKKSNESRLSGLYDSINKQTIASFLSLFTPFSDRETNPFNPECIRQNDGKLIFLNTSSQTDESIVCPEGTEKIYGINEKGSFVGKRTFDGKTEFFIVSSENPILHAPTVDSIDDSMPNEPEEEDSNDEDPGSIKIFLTPRAMEKFFTSQ